MSEFVEINNHFIRKSTINSIDFECDKIYDSDPDYIPDDGYRVADIYVIIN